MFHYITILKSFTKEEINAVLKKAAQTNLKGILDYTDEPLVSIDFKGDAHSSIIDGDMTMVVAEKQVKILSWYDNEYGYSNRLCDLAVLVGNKLPVAVF